MGPFAALRVTTFYGDSPFTDGSPTSPQRTSIATSTAFPGTTVYGCGFPPATSQKSATSFRVTRCVPGASPS